MEEIWEENVNWDSKNIKKVRGKADRKIWVKTIDRIHFQKY